MTLLELLVLLKKHLKFVVALPLVCALATALYCFAVMPNQYTATTSMYVVGLPPKVSPTSVLAFPTY